MVLCAGETYEEFKKNCSDYATGDLKVFWLKKRNPSLPWNQVETLFLKESLSDSLLQYKTKVADGIIFVGYDVFDDLDIMSFYYTQYILHAFNHSSVTEFLDHYVLYNKGEDISKKILTFEYMSPENSVKMYQSAHIQTYILAGLWVFVLVKWFYENGFFFFENHWFFGFRMMMFFFVKIINCIFLFFLIKNDWIPVNSLIYIEDHTKETIYKFFFKITRITSLVLMMSIFFSIIMT